MTQPHQRLQVQRAYRPDRSAVTLQRNGERTQESARDTPGQSVQRKVTPFQTSRPAPGMAHRRTSTPPPANRGRRPILARRTRYAWAVLLGVMTVGLVAAYFWAGHNEPPPQAEITQLRDSLNEQVEQLIDAIDDPHYRTQWLVDGELVLDSLAEAKDTLPAEQEVELEQVLATQHQLRHHLAQYGQDKITETGAP